MEYQTLSADDDMDREIKTYVKYQKRGQIGLTLYSSPLLSIISRDLAIYLLTL